MATSPLTAAAGHHPFADLLFSPRAGFVWNETRGSVAWMNAAARRKLGLNLQDLSGSLPPRLKRQFTESFKSPGEKGVPPSIVTFEIARYPAFTCSLEVLKLAGGHDGLIVTEVQGIEHDSERPGRAKRTGKRDQRAKIAHKVSSRDREGHSNRARPAPALTSEELRAFKEIGRKVRKLCREKQQDGRVRASKVSSPRGPELVLSSVHAAQALRDVLSAFDLLLFLDNDLRIIRIEGRAQRLGWRKSHLRGRHMSEMLAFAEQAIFHRMVKKLEGQAVQICREVLLSRGEFGTNQLCHTILGRWVNEDAAFFLALLSMKIPHRLKKLQSHAFSEPGAHRLAA